MTRTLLDCTERKNTRLSSCRSINSTFKLSPQHSHIQSNACSFIDGFRVLVFSILVPYRDFKELLPQVVAQGTCFVTFYICKIVCVLLVMCPSREKKTKG